MSARHDHTAEAEPTTAQDRFIEAITAMFRAEYDNLPLFRLARLIEAADVDSATLAELDDLLDVVTGLADDLVLARARLDRGTR